jgi:hypothetical protein
MSDDTKLTPEERYNVYTNVCLKCRFEAMCSYIHKRERTPLDCSIVKKYYALFEPRCIVCTESLHGNGTLTSLPSDHIVHLECAQ